MACNYGSHGLGEVGMSRVSASIQVHQIALDDQTFTIVKEVEFQNFIQFASSSALFLPALY